MAMGLTMAQLLEARGEARGLRVALEAVIRRRYGAFPDESAAATAPTLEDVGILREDSGGSLRT
jgi:hypothetical protein